MSIADRFIHRHRTAVVLAVLLGAAGGLLVEAAGVSANSGPKLEVNSSVGDPWVFPREALHHASALGDGNEIANDGTATAYLLREYLSGGTSQDFHIVRRGLPQESLNNLCVHPVWSLVPLSSMNTQFTAVCSVFVRFRPVTLWGKPTSTLVLTMKGAPNFQLPLIGAIPWALKLTSYPQNSTGTPVIVTATANDGSPGALVVNLFVNGQLKTTCESSCQLSLPATSSAGTTYDVAADVGPAGAQPGSKGTAVTRRRTVHVRFTPPSCPSGSCT